jgi:hypothetical protein
MVAWSSSGTAIRVDLNNFKAMYIKIRDKPRYNNLGGSVAISPNGRYLVSVPYSQSTGVEVFIEDLASKCAASENRKTPLLPVSCTSRSLTEPFTNIVKQSIDKVTIDNKYPRFYGNDRFVLYQAMVVDNNYVAAQYVVQAPNTTASERNYIALGDSFAAGEGAFNYELGTDVGPNVNKCHLSKISYPYLINRQLNLDSFHSVACSGARMFNVVGGNRRNNQYARPPGYNENDWFPGDYRQLHFISSYTPNIITISMVGNDIGFADKLQYCVKEPDNCFHSYEDRLELMLEINGKFDSLVNIYKKIKHEAALNAKIYVISYPQIVAPDRNAACALNVRLTESERLLANELTTYLNSMIKRASAKAGVYYVGVESSLDGARLCEGIDGTPLAVNGVTKGDDAPDRFRVIGRESFHPNEFGHQMMNEAILRQTDYFTKPMPTPDSTVTAPSLDNQPLLMGMPRDNRPIRYLNYDDNPKDNIMYKEGWWQATVSTSSFVVDVYKGVFNYYTLPFRLVLHSDPVDLGTITPDEHGNLNIRVKIPASVPTGMHTLHLIGQGEDGQEVDFYRYVFVAESPDDWDGDGIPNTDEPCGAIDSSGQDIDGDGIDDACDGTIGPAIKPPVIDPTKPTEPAKTNVTPIQAQPKTALSLNLQPAIAPSPTGTTIGTSTSSITSSQVLGSEAGLTTLSQPPKTQQKARKSDKAKHAESSHLLPILAAFVLVFAIILTFSSRLRYSKRS